ncbi:MAG: hypothetical protein GZ085_14585 [Sulfuriferula multivorans]|uniref:Uncharacterized protein n=1 Tax=Sulfuriferula multivorans TaxID=1559896 RepID=A0A7C9TBQ7_9PROT|nr:hypothetical protein [Sulfuriferula multivorans]
MTTNSSMQTVRACIEASRSTLLTSYAADAVVRLLYLSMNPINFGDGLIGNL